MDTYILAPNNATNFAVLQQALIDYPEIAQEKRVKYVFEKSAGDITADDGTLLVAENTVLFIYLCATVPPDSPILTAFLDALTEYQLFAIDTQPFHLYWL